PQDAATVDASQRGLAAEPDEPYRGEGPEEERTVDLERPTGQHERRQWKWWRQERGERHRYGALFIDPMPGSFEPCPRDQVFEPHLAELPPDQKRDACAGE